MSNFSDEEERVASIRPATWKNQEDEKAELRFFSKATSDPIGDLISQTRDLVFTAQKEVDEYIHAAERTSKKLREIKTTMKKIEEKSQKTIEQEENTSKKDMLKIQDKQLQDILKIGRTKIDKLLEKLQAMLQTREPLQQTYAASNMNTSSSSSSSGMGYLKGKLLPKGKWENTFSSQVFIFAPAGAKLEIDNKNTDVGHEGDHFQIEPNAKIKMTNPTGLSKEWKMFFMK